MKPQLLTRPQLSLVGIETRTTNRDEMAPSTAKIPGLWGRFFQEGIAERIPNGKPAGLVIGAYTNYESDHTGRYSLVVGSEVSSLESIPDGMVGLTIAAGRFLVFRAQGPMPSALIDTWTYIWDYFSREPRHERLYTVDYEAHHGHDRVDIHIAVE